MKGYGFNNMQFPVISGFSCCVLLMDYKGNDDVKMDGKERRMIKQKIDGH